MQLGQRSCEIAKSYQLIGIDWIQILTTYGFEVEDMTLGQSHDILGS